MGVANLRMYDFNGVQCSYPIRTQVLKVFCNI